MSKQIWYNTESKVSAGNEAHKIRTVDDTVAIYQNIRFSKNKFLSDCNGQYRPRNVMDVTDPQTQQDVIRSQAESRDQYVHSQGLCSTAIV